jgi:hypothetical protein
LEPITVNFFSSLSLSVSLSLESVGLFTSLPQKCPKYLARLKSVIEDVEGCSEAAIVFVSVVAVEAQPGGLVPRLP